MHWSEITKGLLKDLSPPNSLIYAGLARPQLSLKYKFANKPQPKIGPKINPNNANLNLRLYFILFFLNFPDKIKSKKNKQKTGIMIIIFLRISLNCLMKVYFSEINDPSIKKIFEIIISNNG